MADYTRKINETFNQIVNESHTMARLKKLPKNELKKLKTEYTNKMKSATKAGNKEKVEHHKAELNNINKLLGEEQLLNEIGDTPAGRRALKLVKAVNQAKIEGETTEQLFAKMFKTGVDQETAIKQSKARQEASKRMIGLAQKRLGPTDLSAEAIKLETQRQNELEEGILSNLGAKVKSIATSIGKGLDTAAKNMPSTKTLMNFGKDALNAVGTAVQNEQGRTLSKQQSRANLGSMVKDMAGSAANRIAIDQRHKKTFGKP